MDGKSRSDRDRLTQGRYPDERSYKNRVTTSDTVHIPPRPPRTLQPGCKGPTVNRDLKPGRRICKSSSDGRLQSLASADRASAVTAQRPVRSFPRDQLRLPPLPGQTSTDHLNQINQFDVSPPSRPAPTSPQTRYQNNPPAWTESGLSEMQHVKSRAQSSTSHMSQRFSLDLDSQDLSSDGAAECISPDSQLMKHHEWPPTREDTNHSSFSSHSRPVQGLEEQNWYVGAFGRVDAEHALHLVNQEGAFLVRDCSRNTSQEPFVLAVFYDKRVFNIQIRFSEDTNKYTLGTGLRTSEVSDQHISGASECGRVELQLFFLLFQRFDSVTDIIKFHSIFPILLIDGRKNVSATNQRRHCVLMYPITRQDMTALLH